MSVKEFVEKYFERNYEKYSVQDILKAPVSAISGVTEADAADLKKAFGIETVGDLATNKYLCVAQAINGFSKWSGTVLDKEFRAEEFGELGSKPVSAIRGVSKADGALLKKAFGIETIHDLAENKYVMIAQAVAALACLEVLTSKA